MTQSQVAERVGVSRQTIKNWEDGTNVPKRENIRPLCAALATNSDWLLDGKGDPESIERQGALRPPLPVISLGQAGGDESAFDPYAEGEAESWIESTARTTGRAFVLRVTGDSMEPVIPDGALVIVDPGREPKNGDIVVARFEDGHTATLKKLVIDGGIRYLKPVNPSYRTVEIDDDCTIVGVATSAEIDLSGDSI